MTRNGDSSCRAPALSRRKFLQSTLGLGVAPGLISAAAAQTESAGKGRKMLRWQAHTVAKIPNGYQVAVADVNGDGKPDILALSSVESVVEWYENPTWQSRPITTQTQKNISLAPLFRAGYPERGLALATNFALEDSLHGGNLWWAVPPRTTEAEWSLTWFGKITSSHRLRWADLNGDGLQELVDVPLLGPGAKEPDYSVGAPLTWFEMPEALLRGHLSAGEPSKLPWAQHLIDNSLTVVHGVQITDWDGDGRDEILTASFEGVHLFHATGRGPDMRWTKTRLASGDQTSKPRRGASEIGVGTVAGRRFLATIEPWHGEQVVVYREGKPGALWDRQVIDTSLRDGHALACADLDGDGNSEIVAGFRGPGTSLYVYYPPTSPSSGWERQTLDTDMATSCLAVADLNGDRRLDLVAIGASTGNVKWYENLGAT